MICPNLNDPVVAQEFEELVSVVGEDIAYDIWDQNKGYGIDKAPNGEPSILFRDLLDTNDTNRVTAIQEKAKIYSTRFHRWFNPENSTDTNGEPQLSQITGFLKGNQFARVKERFISDRAREPHMPEKEFTYSQTRINDITENAHMINRQVKEGINSRIVALRSRAADPIYTKELRQLRDYLDSIEDQDALYQFLGHLQRDLETPYKFLREAYEKKRSINDNQLIQFKQDYLGFYDTMLSKVADLFNTGYFSELPRESQEYLNGVIKDSRNTFANIRSMYKQLVQESFVSTLRRIGIEAGSPTIESYLANNTFETDNDINWFELYMGSLNNANDEALRSMYYMIQNTKNEIERVTLDRGKKLAKVAGSTDKQGLLFEKDKNGKKTGYMIRPRNYGMFNSDYNNFLSGLREKYNLDRYDEVPMTDEDFVAYNKDKNAWLIKHAERRYKPEYYDIFANLSKETALAREDIQMNINKILNKAKSETGEVDLAVLGASDWEKLQNLYKRKRELSNAFTRDGDEKVGLDLQIATELNKVNEELQKNIVYKPNLEKFERAKREAYMRSLKMKDPSYYQRWLDRNQRVEYTQKFWDDMKRLASQYYGEEYEMLQEKRNEIFKLFRSNKDMQIEASEMPQEVRDLIRDIDERMSNIRESSTKQYGALKFADIAEMVESDDYVAERNKAIERDKTEPGYLAEWTEANHRMSGRHQVPLSFWTYIKPKNPLQIINVPSAAWSEIDPESPWYNKSFDESDMNYIQPKKSLYDNSKAYKEAMRDPNVKALHDEILDVMTESNNKLTFQQNFDPYKLPQISGTAYQHIRSNDNVIKGFFKYVKDNIVVRDDDTEFNTTTIKRPDGSKLYFVPTHYMKMLDDPSTLTNDIAGAAISYFRMAENFKEMNRIAPTVEVIKEQLGARTYNKKSLISRRSETTQGTETKAYRDLDDFLKMHIYGERKQNIEATISGKKLSVTKIMTMMRNYTQAVNLSFNITAMEVGVLTGMHHAFLESLVDRYYSFSDFRKGFGTVMRSLFNVIMNWGNYRSNNKVLSLLELNQVSRDNSEIFSRMNQYRWGRFIANHFWYGGYSGGDFVVKSSILTATYFNHKLIKDPKTGEKRFMNKHEYLTTYFPNDEKRGNRMWKVYNETLYDAYDSIDGRAVIKDKYKDYVTTQLQDSIANTVKFLAAKADGVLNSLDYSYVHANAFTQMVFMHRNFLVVNAQDRLSKKKGFNYQTGVMDEAVYRTAARIVWDWLQRTYENIKAGNIEFASFKIEDASDKANLKKLAFELALLFSYWAISQLWDDAADDDDSAWLTQHIAYMIKRHYFEINAQYDAGDLVSIIKSPSAAMGTLNQIGYLMDIMKPMMYLGEDNHYMFKEIKRGPYKGMEKYQQSLIKATPFKHLVEASDPNLKRKYLMNMVMK